MPEPSIDPQRLWDTLKATAAFGGTAAGGLRRLTLTEDDRRVRDWLAARGREAGCTVTVDAVGNMFLVRHGRDPARAPVACGSHLDTQPTGGRFDGVLGVLAGLEVIRALDDAGTVTAAPVAVVNWTNEEGARFAPALTGSAVHAGTLGLDQALALRDADGASFGDALRDIGYCGAAAPGAVQLGAHFELHIEQGPVLEAEGATIGVVTGAQGIRWYDATLSGQGGHAGTTPMALRRDALAAAAELVLAVRRVAQEEGAPAVGTVGVLRVAEPSRNVIPGEVFLTAELRHPEPAVLERMDAALRAAAAAIAAAQGVGIALAETLRFPAVAFDPGCIDTVRRAAAGLGLRHRDMVSGAGHDSCNIARVTPTAMIFIPCKGGLSHHPAESARFEDVAAGAEVLLRAVLDRAGRG